MDKGGVGDSAAGAAPTGCYKCGRPGHWSRDCPSNPPSSNSNINDDENPALNDNDQNRKASGSAYGYSKKTFKNSGQNSSGTGAENPKRLTGTRPKLTPDLLLSNDGVGYVLKHFPRAFKYRGRGHEVKDLGNLLGMYAEWHSRLLPYFPFDQFVHKVEQIGSTKRVKRCIQELRERVADGVDPAKLHESEVHEDITNQEQGAMDLEEQNPFHENTNIQHPTEENTSVQYPDTRNHQDDILDEIWEKAIEEPSKASDDRIVVADASHGDKRTSTEVLGETSSVSIGTAISEEQRVRMQANRLKALEKAPRQETSSGSVGTTLSEDQRARMEANKLKALEKAAAARARKL